jgi:hypothetical protein
MARSGATPAGYAVSFLGIFIALLCGICVLDRQRWARALYLGWSACCILYSFVTGGFSTRNLPSLVFFLVIVLLLTAGAGDYFKAGQTELNQPEELPTP